MHGYIESHRESEDTQELTRKAGTVFREWGIPTPVSIVNIRKASKKLIIATGGLKTGIDVAKSITIGADIGGFAYKFLKSAWEDFKLKSKSHTLNEIKTLKTELRSALWLLNINNIQELKGNKNIRRIDSKLRSWFEDSEI